MFRRFIALPGASVSEWDKVAAFSFLRGHGEGRRALGAPSTQGGTGSQALGMGGVKFQRLVSPRHW